MFSKEETKGLQEYRNTLEKIISLTANLNDSDNTDAIESILGDSGKLSEAIKNLESTVSSDGLSSDDELEKLLGVSRIIEVSIEESKDQALMLAELLKLAPVAQMCFDSNIDYDTLLDEINEGLFLSVSSSESSVSSVSSEDSGSSVSSEDTGSTDSEPQKNSSLLTRLYNFTLSTTPRRIATLLAFIFVASAIAAAIYFSGGLVIPFLGLIAIKTSPVTLGLILGALGLSAAGLLGVTVWPYVDKRGGGSAPVDKGHSANADALSSTHSGLLLKVLKVSNEVPNKVHNEAPGSADNQCGLRLNTGSCDAHGNLTDDYGEEMKVDDEQRHRNNLN